MDFELVNKLRDKVDIEKVISKYINISKKGSNYQAICPFHADTKPSLSISTQKKIYKCFSCGVGGDVFAFVKNYENISFFNAVLEVIKIMEITDFDVSSLKNLKAVNQENEKLFKINEDAAKYFSNFLKNNENKFALKYLQDRNISDEMIKNHQIGFAPKDSSILVDLLTNNENILNNKDLGFNNIDIKKVGLSSIIEGEYNSFFYNRIIFPIHNIDNRIIGFSGRVIDNKEPKYLNTPTTEIFNKNKTLYNLNNVIKNNNVEKLYITEGFMDVIAIEKIGVENAVCTMGTSFGNEHIKTLRQLYDLKSIILCFDNDDAGIEATIKNGSLLNKYYDVFVVNYDSDFKDIDEIYNNQGIDSTLKTLKNVDYFAIYSLKKLAQKYNFKDDSDLNSFIKLSEIIMSEIRNDLFFIKTIEKISEITSLSIDLLTSIYKREVKRQSNKTYYSHRKEENLFFRNHKIDNIPIKDGSELGLINCFFINKSISEEFHKNRIIFKDKDILDVYTFLQYFYEKNPNLSSIRNLTITTVNNFLENNDFTKKEVISLHLNKLYSISVHRTDKANKAAFEAIFKQLEIEKSNEKIDREPLEKAKENIENREKIKVNK